MTRRSLPVAFALIALINIPSVAAEKGDVFKFLGGGEGNAAGHKAAFVNLQPLTGGAPVRLFVANDDKNQPRSEIIGKLKDLQPGQLVRVELEKWNGNPAVRSIEQVTVKPGEDTPHGFVFAEAYQDLKTHQQVVKLTRYGQPVVVAVPMTKDGPDAALMDRVNKFKEGDVVLAQLASGRVPQLLSIYPYSAPQTGKVQKVEEKEVEGQKRTAVVIDAEGKTVTALVPGKTVNKRWQSDPQIQRAAKSVRPGTEVDFISLDDDGKTLLIDIQKARPAPKETARSRDKK